MMGKERRPPTGKARETSEPDSSSSDSLQRAVMQRKVAERRRERAAAESGASPGQALPKPLQAKMGAALGADFSSVRVHEGPEAERVGAEAYAQGQELHFAPGRYQPESQRGQELIGHELSHVVQQASGRVQPTIQKKGGHSINDDPGLESEADELGARAARGEPARSGTAVTPAAGGTAQRQVIQRGGCFSKGAKKPPEPEKDEDDSDLEFDEEEDEDQDETKEKKGKQAAAVEIDGKVYGEGDAEKLWSLLVAEFPVLLEYKSQLAGKLAELLAGKAPLHSLKEVARALAPGLLVGEHHQDMLAKQFITGNLGPLRAMGYDTLGIETFGGTPMGDMLIADGCKSPLIQNGMTLQQCLDAALREPAIAAFFVDAYFPRKLEMVQQALRNGMRVVCLDYDVSKFGNEGGKRVSHFDDEAAAKLNPLADAEHHFVALVGADHLPGMEARTGAPGLDKRSEQRKKEEQDKKEKQQQRAAAKKNEGEQQKDGEGAEDKQGASERLRQQLLLELEAESTPHEDEQEEEPGADTKASSKGEAQPKSSKGADEKKASAEPATLLGRTLAPLLGGPIEALLAAIHAAPPEERRNVLGDKALLDRVRALSAADSTTVMSALLEGSLGYANPGTLANDFSQWLLADGELNPTCSMNCWEAILYSAILAGHLDKPRVTDLYFGGAAANAKAKDKNEKSTQQVWQFLGFDPALPQASADQPPPAGAIVFFSKGTSRDHVAISVGGGMMLSLWTMPFQPANVTRLEIASFAKQNHFTAQWGRPPW